MFTFYWQLSTAHRQQPVAELNTHPCLVCCLLSMVINHRNCLCVKHMQPQYNNTVHTTTIHSSDNRFIQFKSHSCHGTDILEHCRQQSPALRGGRRWNITRKWILNKCHVRSTWMPQTTTSYISSTTRRLLLDHSLYSCICQTTFPLKKKRWWLQESLKPCHQIVCLYHYSIHIPVYV